MEINKEILFNLGHKMKYKYAPLERHDGKVLRDIDKNITAIECLNPKYGKESVGDWLYNVTYDYGTQTFMVFHNHILVEPLTDK